MALVLTLGLFSLGDRTMPTAASVNLEPAVTVLSDGVRVSWQAPELLWEETDDGAVKGIMPDFDSLHEPGKPILPISSVLVAVPPGAEPQLTIETNNETAVSLPATLALAPKPEGVIRDAGGQIIGGDFVVATEAIAFAPPVVAYEDAGVVRGVRLARLTFYPLRPISDGVLITTNVTVRLDFNRKDGPNLDDFENTEGLSQLDSLQKSLTAMVVNPGHIQPQTPPLAALSQISGGSANVTAMIEVSQPGITTVTYDDLVAGGYPLATINPQNVHLVRDGTEVRIEWNGDGDSSFEQGERFLFYADPHFSRWTHSDSYMLWAENAPGLRMTTQGAKPDGLASGSANMETVVESNLIYTPDCMCGSLPSGRDGDRWVWDDLRQPGRPSNSYTVELPTVNTNAAATLTLWLIGFTAVDASPDHNVRVTLNGTNLGDITWDGKTTVTQTVSVPAGTLQTSNILELELPGIAGVSVEGTWLDAVAVNYVRGSEAVGTQVQFQGENPSRAYTVSLAATSGLRGYDITNPAAPTRLTGVQISGNSIRLGDHVTGQRRYALATEPGLLSPTGVRLKTPLQTAGISGADIIMIAPEAFIPALDPLVNLREGQGMAVAVEALEAIFANFAEGEPTPEAIRDYLANAYASWNPRPATVLLVGDGTNDPKLYRDDSKVSWLPPFLVDVDPWIGEVPADNRFVTLDGDDILPDMAIGRLPANSLEEVQIIIKKIVQYETAPVLGDWNGRVTFVADDQDSAGNFAGHANILLNAFIADPWLAETIYHTPPATTESQIQSNIQGSWNMGRGIIIFNGHSSVHQWGAERYFHLDDVANLNNGGRLPVVLEMTCFTGSFQQPFWDTLDEALLRREGGGAVAVWGPTGLGVATGHVELADGFMDSLIAQNEPTLGAAVVAAKVNLIAQQTAHQDLVDTFILFGDPAMQYNFDFWPGFGTYLPLIQR